jgi:RHS repeat-associated protein
MERDSKSYYYVYDGHGSVRALTDQSGTVTDTYDYDAYGNLLGKTGTTENDYLYVGEQYNASTGLYYLRARYMDPSTGTFISMDSYSGSNSDSITLHKYLYANANPVVYSDPTGNYSLAATMSGLGAQSILSEQQATYDAVILNIGLRIISSLSPLRLLSISGAVLGSTLTAMLMDEIGANIDHLTDVIADFGDYVFDIATEEWAAQVIAYTYSLVGTLTVEQCKNYTVYVLIDKQKTIKYVGRTCNPKARGAAHKRNPKKEGYDFKPVIINLNKTGARLAEQALISSFTLQKLDNRIRGISRKKLNEYDKYMKKYDVDLGSILKGLPENERLDAEESIDLLGR